MKPADFSSAVRTIVALASLLLVTITGSGALRIDRHLNEFFKCGACRVRAAQLTDGRRSAGLAANRQGQGGRPVTSVLGRIAPGRFVYDTPTPVEPLELPAVAHALGVSVPKARRWAVLGGHGRNGVG